MNEFWIGFVFGVAAAYLVSLFFVLLLVRFLSGDEPESSRRVSGLNGHSKYKEQELQ